MTKEVDGVNMAIPCETYSRISGYYRQVSQWNKGKKEEFRQRKVASVKTIIQQVGDQVCVEK